MTKVQSASVGTCAVCGSRTARGAMTRHLRACVRRAEGEVELLEVQVGSVPGPALYWLHLDAEAGAMLEDLDLLLRETWLECCSHMSAFEIGGRRFAMDSLGRLYVDDPCTDPEPDVLADLLRVGTSFRYRYDFGTPTRLQLKATGARRGALPRAPEREDGPRRPTPRSSSTRHPRVVVLARNDPPAWACRECGAPATRVPAQGRWDGRSLSCDACAGGEDEGLRLPVVNSPRMGDCAYTGT
jgi:hypothetical protein